MLSSAGIASKFLVLHHVNFPYSLNRELIINVKFYWICCFRWTVGIQSLFFFYLHRLISFYAFCWLRKICQLRYIIEMASWQMRSFSTHGEYWFWKNNWRINSAVWNSKILLVEKEVPFFQLRRETTYDTYMYSIQSASLGVYLPKGRVLVAFYVLSG